MISDNWYTIPPYLTLSCWFLVAILQKLENVAINDVLPLKAARRDAIANLKCVGALEHQRPNFNGFIYIHCAAPPEYGSHQRHLLPSVWQNVVGFRLLTSVCNA